MQESCIGLNFMYIKVLVLAWFRRKKQNPRRGLISEKFILGKIPGNWSKIWEWNREGVKRKQLWVTALVTLWELGFNFTRGPPRNCSMSQECPRETWIIHWLPWVKGGASSFTFQNRTYQSTEGSERRCYQGAPAYRWLPTVMHAHN